MCILLIYGKTITILEETVLLNKHERQDFYMDNGQNGPNGQNGQNDENNDGKKNGELKMSVIICMILIFAIIILFAYVKDKIDETQNVEISYGEFLEKLEKAPKGIFKLAVFQRRRDEYYQKLLDEEDRLCDDYKIK